MDHIDEEHLKWIWQSLMRCTSDYLRAESKMMTEAEKNGCYWTLCKLNKIYKDEIDKLEIEN